MSKSDKVAQAPLTEAFCESNAVAHASCGETQKRSSAIDQTSSLKMSNTDSEQNEMPKNNENYNSDSEVSEVSVFVPHQKEQISHLNEDNPHYPFD